MNFPSRVQAGVPTGGQFAATQHAEADVTVDFAPVSGVKQAQRVLREARSHLALAQRAVHDAAEYAIRELARQEYPGARKVLIRRGSDHARPGAVGVIDADGNFVAFPPSHSDAFPDNDSALRRQMDEFSADLLWTDTSYSLAL